MKTTKGKTNMPMTTKTASEHDEQVGLVNWFRGKFPGVRMFAIPNGGHRAISVGRALQAEGVSPGVPDLYIPAWGLWVEMKRATGGRLSPEQKDWIAYLVGLGQVVIVGKGATDASRQILAYWNDYIRNAGLP